jgi:hypothetical protein
MLQVFERDEPDQTNGLLDMDALSSLLSRCRTSPAQNRPTEALPPSAHVGPAGELFPEELPTHGAEIRAQEHEEVRTTAHPVMSTAQEVKTTRLITEPALLDLAGPPCHSRRAS